MGNQRELTPEQRSIANLCNNPDFQQLVKYGEAKIAIETEAAIGRIITEPQGMVLDAVAKGRVLGIREILRYVNECAKQAQMEQRT